MAGRFLTCTESTDYEDAVFSSGTSPTSDNVAIVFDDTGDPASILAAIERAKRLIAQRFSE